MDWDYKKGKSAKNGNSAISNAERLLVYYLENYGNKKVIALKNDKLKNNPPKNPFALINRCYKKKSKEEYRKAIFPFSRIPQYIYWDGKGCFLSAKKIDVKRDAGQD